jgi:hypothetical protein
MCTSEPKSDAAKSSRQAHRQRLEHRFFHSLAHPADALAQQHDQLDCDPWLPLEKTEKILPPQHEQLGRLAGGRIRVAILAIEHRDFAEQIARPKKVQGQPAAVGGAGFDPDLAAAHPEQGIARIALLKKHFASVEMLGMAKHRNPLQFVRAEIGEHRIHFQNNRKFGLLVHCAGPPLIAPKSKPEGTTAELCHKSHIFAAPDTYFWRLGAVPIPG